MTQENLPSQEQKLLYWRKNIKLLAILLSIWFLVSYGLSIIFIDELDRVKIPGTGFKLGFWFAQQGSIYIYLILIGIYVRVMNRLDRELLGEQQKKS